jgi:hypothetical protein
MSTIQFTTDAGEEVEIDYYLTSRAWRGGLNDPPEGPEFDYLPSAQPILDQLSDAELDRLATEIYEEIEDEG